MNYGKYDTICLLLFFVDLQWIVFYWSGKSITNNNKYNEYNHNPAATKFHSICFKCPFTDVDIGCRGNITEYLTRDYQLILGTIVASGRKWKVPKILELAFIKDFGPHYLRQ